MLKNKIRLIILLSILGLISIEQVSAQSYISSPYSAYGLGNFTDANSVRNKSMGGLGIGVRDYFTVNVANPASYSAFDSTSFIFEGAVYGHYTVLKTEDLSENLVSANLGHLLMGFPVAKWWRSSIGLLPYTAVGYNINDFTNHENIGNTQYVFEGEGGISKLNWGNSIRPLKNLSLGLNAAYMFGTIDRVNKITFPDSIYMISTINNNVLSVHDIDLEFGVQYHPKIKDRYNLVIGATYHPETNLKTKYNSMVRSYQSSVGTYELILDTISQEVIENGNIVFPQTIGFGFSIARGYRWMAGAEYKFEQWENFKAYNLYDSLSNRHTFKFGGHFIPDQNSSSYLNRIDIRLGANYNISHLNLRGEQLDGFGITFGLGLPVRSNAMRGTRSMINLGFEIGRLGTTNNSLIQENYYNAFMSISIFERWFVKRRYR